MLNGCTSLLYMTDNGRSKHLPYNRIKQTLSYVCVYYRDKTRAIDLPQHKLCCPFSDSASIYQLSPSVTGWSWIGDKVETNGRSL